MSEHIDLQPADVFLREELKLLSINRASELLGIRYEKTKQFMEEGKIKSIDIYGRKKTTIKYLREFLELNTNTNTITNNIERSKNYSHNTNNINNRFNEILERKGVK